MNLIGEEGWFGWAEEGHPALSAEWKRWVMAAGPQQTNQPQFNSFLINLINGMLPQFDWFHLWNQSMKEEGNQ